MGERKVNIATTTDQRKKFVECLLEDVESLDKMLERGMIESGVKRIGAEQELCFMDNAWRPAPIVIKVLEGLNDSHFTTELAQYNMEINLDPLEFSSNSFSRLRANLIKYLTMAEKVVGKENKLTLTGILPTIRSTDLSTENMTPVERYKALDQILKELRGGEFEFRINGTDELITRHSSVMFESCNTSFQVHYQTDPDDFVKTYNWSQAVSGPLLASATNSPLFLGKRLWSETRIALFQQSIDFRQTTDLLRERSPRVYFGNRWINDPISNIFKEDIVRHKIIICKEIEKSSLQVLEEGKIPLLEALMVHNGTIYKWNRACYGVLNGIPHLRIENRILPAGPTVDDELANAAFWIGLMNGLPDNYRNIDKKMEFDDAKTNFLKAARQGLYSQFRWINGKKVTSQDLILKELLPIALEGLERGGIKKADVLKYLGIIRERVETGKTGSQWTLDSFEHLKRKHGKDEAIVATTAAMYKRQKTGKPVHKWKPARLDDAGSWIHYYWRIDQIMSTDLFAVQEDDFAHLVVKIMDWRHVRHVPVENKKGEVVGLITSGLLVHTLIDHPEKRDFSIKDIMIKNPITIPPDTLTTKALELMIQHKVGCLLVVKEKKLVGIVTEHDFVDISAQLFKELKEKINNGVESRKGS